MHDIRLIRNDPEAYERDLQRRGIESFTLDFRVLDEHVRGLKAELELRLSERKKYSAEFYELQTQVKKLKASDEVMRLNKEIMNRYDSQYEWQELLNDRETAYQQLVKLEKRLSVASRRLEIDLLITPKIEESLDVKVRAFNDYLAALPNRPAADVPDGTDEADNVEFTRWGTPRSFDFAPKEHADLGPPLGLDFQTGASIAGARFTFLRGQMARLQRGLGQFMLDTQTAAGFTECAPPLLVRDEALFGTGQLPKFAEDNFRTTDGRWLIPTAEVSLTNAVREQILVEAQLPIRMTALTPCFRSEAGAAGKDTRGYIRQHQFEKVELVSVCRPEESEAEHERMVEAAAAILRALDLPYRKMLLCAGDMGFTARKTYDLEVWLPGQDAYREISSVSNCGDFQARRMNAQYRPKGQQKGPWPFVHTLNGSGLAVGRTLVAVLENYQEADGSVSLPQVLHPYMGGVTRLVPPS